MSIGLNENKQESLRFAVVVLVGPADDEQYRVLDLLRSLSKYEPSVSRVVLVDDSLREREFAQDIGEILKIECIRNPRRGRGGNLTGGLCAGMIAGLKYIASSLQPECEFIVKLDTDALVVAPFAAKLARLFRENSLLGLAGAHRFTPNGDPRDFSCWSEIVRDLGRIWIANGKRLRRAGRLLPIALWGRAARRRHWVRRALAQNYVAGENVLGGSYAISAAAVRTLLAASALDDPLLWVDTELGEDVLVSLLVKAVGMELVDFCSDGDAFGVRYKGLPDEPARLTARGFSIIHSVKNDTQFTEDEIREFFAQRRRGAVR